MFRERPSSIRRAFSGGGLKAFRGSPRFNRARKRRRLILGPHVSCPVCGSHFKDWMAAARHMTHDSPAHYDEIKKLTGKTIIQLRGKGSLSIIAKSLEKRYGKK